MPAGANLAQRFADAVASKDHDALRQLLHADIDFRALTPEHVWFPPGPDGVVDSVAEWFDESDDILAVEYCEVGAFADCERAGYRFLIQNGTARHLVEQQVYLRERDGKIGWLRVLCSGYREVKDSSGIPTARV